MRLGWSYDFAGAEGIDGRNDGVKIDQMMLVGCLFVAGLIAGALLAFLTRLTTLDHHC